MKRVIVGLLVLVVSLLSSNLMAADYANPTKEDLVAFVNEAVDYVHKEGKEKALAEFMNKDGKFFRGELYIYAYDFDGNVLAHGAKPQLVGKNLLRLRDANGLAVIEELIKVAKGGQGFLKFYWDNPVEKKVMPKLGYSVKIDDTWWLGSGIYEK